MGGGRRGNPYMEGQASLRLSGRVQTLWRAAQRCSGVIGHGGVASPTSPRRIFTQPAVVDQPGPPWAATGWARVASPSHGSPLTCPPTSPPDQGKNFLPASHQYCSSHIRALRIASSPSVRSRGKISRLDWKLGIHAGGKVDYGGAARRGRRKFFFFN